VDYREEIFTIENKLGLHARAAALFVQLASKFKSDIYVRKDHMEVNGKSIMGVMMLAAAKGTRLKIRAVGEDSFEAVEALGRLIKDRFRED